MNKILLLLAMFVPLAAQADFKGSDLAAQCSHSGKNTELMSNVSIDQYISSNIYNGQANVMNVNLKINNSYYLAFLREHPQWTNDYPGEGSDIAKTAFTAYTLGKKVTVCVNKSGGFIYGISF